MPTATDYRTTASKIDALTTACNTARSGVRSIGGETGVRGGPFADAIDRGLDTTVLNLVSVSAQCVEASAEAHRRARTCDVYTADMKAYRLKLEAWETDPALPKPSEPVRPAPWVEEG